ncbi:hypothetical protein C8R44DRAFT_744675 [Mycena epipterygia]|nr:hypothetical protein C8R44DRAFT_744675 [Mycena epipterygia]
MCRAGSRALSEPAHATVHIWELGPEFLRIRMERTDGEANMLLLPWFQLDSLVGEANLNGHLLLSSSSLTHNTMTRGRSVGGRGSKRVGNFSTQAVPIIHAAVEGLRESYGELVQRYARKPWEGLYRCRRQAAAAPHRSPSPDDAQPAQRGDDIKIDLRPE